MEENLEEEGRLVVKKLPVVEEEEEEMKCLLEATEVEVEVIVWMGDVGPLAQIHVEEDLVCE